MNHFIHHEGGLYLLKAGRGRLEEVEASISKRESWTVPNYYILGETADSLIFLDEGTQEIRKYIRDLEERTDLSCGFETCVRRL